jgi:hypothetical protein
LFLKVVVVVVVVESLFSHLINHQKARGKVAVNVTFTIDANGILEVTATLKDDSQVSEKLVINQNKVCFVFFFFLLLSSLNFCLIPK